MQSTHTLKTATRKLNGLKSEHALLVKAGNADPDREKDFHDWVSGREYLSHEEYLEYLAHHSYSVLIALTTIQEEIKAAGELRLEAGVFHDKNHKPFVRLVLPKN